MAERWEIHPGDCRDVIPGLGLVVDAVVTDPPYGLNFMGRAWDKDIAFDWVSWAIIAEALKPGGWLLAFGGTRTYHKLASAIEEAGLEIQDTILWLYGSGLPKRPNHLKPACEPIVLAYRPGGDRVLNIEGCRVGTESTLRMNHAGTNGAGYRFGKKEHLNGSAAGRWPANVTHDGCLGEGWGRYFYTAKADDLDRFGSKHPTIKPVALMRWLVRLVCPSGGTVLDPFAGSGTTGVGALAEGCRPILIEREPEYVADIEARMAHWAGAGAHSTSARARHTNQRTLAPLFPEGAMSAREGLSVGGEG